MSNFKWYAIYCIANKEKQVTEKLKNVISINKLDQWVDRIEVPTEKHYVFVKNKKTIREKIMIPGYVLLNIDISNPEVLVTIKSIPGVLGFINPSSGGITRNNPEEMKLEDVSRFLEVADNQKNPKWKYGIGDVVKINNGAFSTFNGRIKVINDIKKSMDLTVMIFNREMSVSVGFEDVEKIGE